MLSDRRQALEPRAIIARALKITIRCICNKSCTGTEEAELCLGMTAGNPLTSSPRRAETSARSPSPPIRSVSPFKEAELHQRGEIL